MKIWSVMLIVAVILAAVCGGLYLLAIMPRVWRKPDRKPFAGWLYAHRGLHDNETDAPENSRKAFQKAVDAGFGIELDIQLTRDKVPVVFHDYTLKRICGADGKVSDYTYEELKQFHLAKSAETIPTLKEILALVGGRVPLIVEFKVEWADLSLCMVAAPILDQYTGVYCMESFNPLAVLWYRRKRKKVVRGQLSQDFSCEKEYKGPLYFALQHLLLNFLTKPDFVAFHHEHHSRLSRRLCRSLYGNTAVAWTIRSENELAEAKKHFDLFIFDSFIPQKW